MEVVAGVAEEVGTGIEAEVGRLDQLGREVRTAVRQVAGWRMLLEGRVACGEHNQEAEVSDCNQKANNDGGDGGSSFRSIWKRIRHVVARWRGHPD